MKFEKIERRQFLEKGDLLFSDWRQPNLLNRSIIIELSSSKGRLRVMDGKIALQGYNTRSPGQLGTNDDEIFRRTVRKAKS